jgi:hypothetical protein
MAKSVGVMELGIEEHLSMGTAILLRIILQARPEVFTF